MLPGMAGWIILGAIVGVFALGVAMWELATSRVRAGLWRPVRLGGQRGLHLIGGKSATGTSKGGAVQQRPRRASLDAQQVRGAPGRTRGNRADMGNDALRPSVDSAGSAVTSDNPP